MPSYNPPSSSYTSKITPGMAAIRKVCMPFFGVGDSGIVRDKKRCPPSGPKSIHCECRAWDAKVTAPSLNGDALANWAAANMDALGIQEVIWNKRACAYWNDYKWGPYGGASDHTDHVHIGLNRWGAANVTEQMVRALLPGAVPIEEDEMKIVKQAGTPDHYRPFELNDGVGTVAMRWIGDGSVLSGMAKFQGGIVELTAIEFAKYRVVGKP